MIHKNNHTECILTKVGERAGTPFQRRSTMSIKWPNLIPIACYVSPDEIYSVYATLPDEIKKKIFKRLGAK